MATVESNTTMIAQRPIVLYDVPWETYLSLAKANGEYRPISRSLSFSTLSTGDIDAFLAEFDNAGENALVAKFRQWVRRTLSPRSTA